MTVTKLAPPTANANTTPKPSTLRARTTPPTSYGPHYTEADKAKVLRVYEWLYRGEDTTGRSRANLARASGVSSALMSQVLAGQYPSPPTPHLDLMVKAIQIIDERERGIAQRIPFVETRVWMLAQQVCDRARELRDFGVLFGYVGTGKTTALRQYVERSPGALYLRAFGGLSRSVLMNDLVDLTGAHVRSQSKGKYAGTNADKKRAVIAVLRGSERLLIIDEAERMAAACFDDLRDISDDAGIGIVLAGTEHLEPLVQDERGRFGQIASRVGFWPPVIKHIQEDDAYQIVQAVYGEQLPTPEVLDMYWQCCGGSARTLSKLLAVVIKACHRKKAAPTAEIVSDAFHKTMRPQRLRKRGGGA